MDVRSDAELALQTHAAAIELSHPTSPLDAGEQSYNPDVYAIPGSSGSLVRTARARYKVTQQHC